MSSGARGKPQADDATLCAGCGRDVQGGSCSSCGVVANGTRVERRPRDHDVTRIHPFVPNDVIDGRWRIISELSRGSMGIVYRAHDLQTNTPAAMKALLPEYCRTPEYMVRFQRETEILGQLAHPNIVPLLALGRRGAMPWFAMPYIQGETLHQVLLRRQSLDNDTAVELIKQVGAGLAFLHERALVHRDLKPSNVFAGHDGTFTILDFGLVRDLNVRSYTAPETRMGTPYYMSPEQVRGTGVDHRADIYAFGALIFAALTGRPPFVGKTNQEIFRAHTEQPPPDARELRPNLPRAAAEALKKALAKDPKKRFQKVGDLMSRLRGVLGSATTLRGPSRS